jgi:hypothetical protein
MTALRGAAVSTTISKHLRMSESCSAVDVWNKFKLLKTWIFNILMQVACETEDNTGILSDAQQDATVQYYPSFLNLSELIPCFISLKITPLIYPRIWQTPPESPCIHFEAITERPLSPGATFVCYTFRPRSADKATCWCQSCPTRFRDLNRRH